MNRILDGVMPMSSTSDLASSLSFPSNFLWGTATASFQVEGAAEADGRSPSIWDTFCRTPGAVAHGHTGDVGSDQYHRYAEDVGLMKELGIGAYRFSLAWPRILPNGTGKVNPKGFEYYHRLLDALHAAEIRPAVTLYHWDLPQVLEDRGGWTNRDIVGWFGEYAEAVYKELGDKVDFWMTLNEPFCTAILGYLSGHHAPGITERAKAYAAVHHLHLAHGSAVDAYRATGQGGEIGIVLNLSTPRPATGRPEDIEAADRATDMPTRMFLDPIMGRGYPERHLAAYPDAPVPVLDGDLEKISRKIDFIGINYYTEHVVAFDPDSPEKFRSVPQCEPVTDMGWPIVPKGFHRHLRWIAENTNGLPLYVTENGCAMPDELDDTGTRCHDPRRIDYLRSHLGACARAIADGVPLKGYFVWSFIDNFEWAFGYTRRFGIVYCDYLDARRIPKDSFYFFRDVVSGAEA